MEGNKNLLIVKRHKGAAYCDGEKIVLGCVVLKIAVQRKKIAFEGFSALTDEVVEPFDGWIGR